VVIRLSCDAESRRSILIVSYVQLKDKHAFVSYFVMCKRCTNRYHSSQSEKGKKSLNPHNYT
jgi:hypothetical protein